MLFRSETLFLARRSIIHPIHIHHVANDKSAVLLVQLDGGTDGFGGGKPRIMRGNSRKEKGHTKRLGYDAASINIEHELPSDISMN